MVPLVLCFPRMVMASPGVDDPLRELAEAAKAGDPRAFTRLYERTRDLAWKALFRVVGPSPDLEDLLQESYLQLLKSLPRWRKEARVTTFLHRVCVNTALMHLRTRKRRPEDAAGELPVQAAPAQDGPEQRAQVTQAAALVQRALARMSEDRAAVFAYHDLLGLGPEEISELVDAPVNTVRSRLNRARAEFTALVATHREPTP